MKCFITFLIFHELFIHADLTDVVSMPLKSGPSALHHLGSSGLRLNSAIEDRDSKMIQFMSLTDTHDIDTANHWVISMLNIE